MTGLASIGLAGCPVRMYSNRVLFLDISCLNQHKQVFILIVWSATPFLQAITASFVAVNVQESISDARSVQKKERQDVYDDLNIRISVVWNAIRLCHAE
jgi:hypothetical protein